MNEKIKESLKEESTWLRLIFTVLFAIIGNVAMTIVWCVALVQFVVKIILGTPLEALDKFADQFSIYFAQVVRYVMFQTEQKPFPFSDWPQP